jgi:6-phosphogluconolactonase (cycloisomerase 2 family)
MKFIKQPEYVREISSMTISPKKQFLCVCERHKNDSSTYIAIYDIKNLFK